jgi:hypothetical protein
VLNQAAAIASGMTYQGLMEGAWDLIPWTWLLDWFVNVKDFATQNSNAIPATHQGACVMTHRIQSRQWKTTSLTNGLRGGDGVDTYEAKNRYVGSGSIQARLPLYSVSRLKILSALFVQNFKPKALANFMR